MADPADIWARDGGVYFGFGSNRLEDPPPPLLAHEQLCYVGDRHLVTIGPNGSGKTRRVLLPNLATLTGWSMLVVDPKGDLAAMTARHRISAGSETVFLNPFNVLGIGSTGFNPVEALDPADDDFADDALGLAEAMIHVRGQDPHWSESAQDLVAAIIMYVRLDKPAGSLADVRAILGKPATEFRDVVREMMRTGVRRNCEELTIKAGRFAELSAENRELNSVISTALTQTRWLDSRPIKADLARANKFNFASMKDRPTTVYLVLPAKRLATHSTWLRLMIAAMLQSLMKDTRPAKVPVMLMLDEFAQLGHFPVIENNLALMRGYGLKLWVVFQDLAQAKAIYGNRWESFLGNAGVLQSFAPQDVGTAEHLSKMTGQAGREVLNWSQQSEAGKQSTGGTISMSKTPMPLMLPQDLRNMGAGYFVMFSHKAKGTIPGFAPFPTELPDLKAITGLDPAARATVPSSGQRETVRR